MNTYPTIHETVRQAFGCRTLKEARDEVDNWIREHASGFGEITVEYAPSDPNRLSSREWFVRIQATKTTFGAPP